MVGALPWLVRRFDGRCPDFVVVLPRWRKDVVMGVVGIDHVQLAMPPGGEEAARDFYEGVLGIPEVPKPDRLAARGGCWFESPPLRVHLGVEDGHRPARKAHPGLAVDDLAAFVDGLIAAGIEVQDEGVVDGMHQVHVSDPFGNRLELIERQR